MREYGVAPLVLLSLFLIGCPSPPADDTDLSRTDTDAVGSCPGIRATIGHGESSFLSFTDAPIEHTRGPQGSYHAFLALRVEGIVPEIHQTIHATLVLHAPDCPTSVDALPQFSDGCGIYARRELLLGDDGVLFAPDSVSETAGHIMFLDEIMPEDAHVSGLIDVDCGSTSFDTRPIQ